MAIEPLQQCMFALPTSVLAFDIEFKS